MAGADYAFNWLVNKGYAPHQAAGIVGNLVQESGVNPTVAPGDNGTAFGIAQWRGPRLAGLQSYAQQNGQDWRSMDAQLGFLDHELNTSEKGAGDALRASGDVGGATRAFTGFERPRGWTLNNPDASDGFSNRLGAAQGLVGGTGTVANAVTPAPTPPVTIGDVLPAAAPPQQTPDLGAIAQQFTTQSTDQSMQKTDMAKAEATRRRALFGHSASPVAAMFT